MQTLRGFARAPYVAGGAGHQRRAMVAVRSTPPTWAAVKPADSSDSPFKELELMEIWDGTGKTRVRQHVNPFNRQFQQPTAAPDWSTVFDDPCLPLALDIGSGYGRFLMLLQRNNPGQRVNYLGLEIRKPLVDRSNEWVARLGQRGRLHYIFTNATVSLASLLRDYPGPLTDVFVQFPDPHFKRRHHKRRVVQPQLVAALRDLMPPGGRLLLQSDVEEVAVAMRNMFEKHAFDAFELAPQHSQCPVFFSNGGDRPAGRQGGQTEAQPGQQGGTSGAAQGHDRQVVVEEEEEEEARGGSSSLQSPAAASRGGSVEGFGAGMSSEGDGSESDGGGGGSGGESDARDGDSGDEEDITKMVSEWAKGGWLVDNPVGTPTEREHYVSQQGLPVYRVALVRRA